jgi:hypothetical protein
MREVGESDCLAHRVIFLDPLAIVGRHLPPGDFLEYRAEFLVVLVEARLFHFVIFNVECSMLIE